LEEIISGEGVVAIEWPDRLKGYLTVFLSIRIDILDDDTRKITLCSCRHENENMIERIDQKLKEKKWH
jgi:tRNA A37 threonylcarbamoyladenosine biosynthesis protein TsaE